MELTRSNLIDAFADQIVNNAEEYSNNHVNAKKFNFEFGKTIDGIKCVVQMNFVLPKHEFDINTCYWTVLIIEIRTGMNVYGNYRNYIEAYTKECIADNINKCIELVNSLRFSILANRMVRDKTNLIELIKDNSDERHIFGEIMFRKDEDDMKCSVCLELTTNVLKCDHYLCMSCIHKMNKGKCPLCRRAIHEINCQCSDCEHDDWNGNEEYE